MIHEQPKGHNQVVQTEAIPHVSADMVLRHHDIPHASLSAFVAEQERGIAAFTIHAAHHADVSLVRHEESGLLLVKKKYGTQKPIPRSVAEQLVEDYRTHERRLLQVGMRIAHTYNLHVDPIEGTQNAVITGYQCFFPQGTALDWLRDDTIPAEVLTKVSESVIRDTVLPALEYTAYGMLSPEVTHSILFVDAAPKNVAPLMMQHGMHTYYFDLFMPRVRAEGGAPKTYDGFTMHKRSEAEMHSRFFTRPGIVHNVIRKMYLEFGPEHRAWKIFASVAERSDMLGDHLAQHFPNMTIQQVAESSFSDRVPS